MQNPTIRSLEELDRLIAQKAAKTRTLPIETEVLEAYRKRTEVRLDMRPLSEGERRDVADYLEVEVGSIPFDEWRMSDMTCPACGRAMNFSDLAHEGISSGRHSRAFVVDILQGRYGSFIVVEGTDDREHMMRCRQCGFRGVKISESGSLAHNCSMYAYCAWGAGWN